MLTDQELSDLATKAATDIIRELVACGAMQQPFGASMIGERHILAALRRAAGGQYEAKDRETITFAATLCANLSRQQTLDDRDRRACADLRGWLETLEAKIYPPMPAPPSDEEK